MTEVEAEAQCTHELALGIRTQEQWWQARASPDFTLRQAGMHKLAGATAGMVLGVGGAAVMSQLKCIKGTSQGVARAWEEGRSAGLGRETPFSESPGVRLGLQEGS